jgi:hypothetical protein
MNRKEHKTKKKYSDTYIKSRKRPVRGVAADSFAWHGPDVDGGGGLAVASFSLRGTGVGGGGGVSASSFDVIGANDCIGSISMTSSPFAIVCRLLLVKRKNTEVEGQPERCCLDSVIYVNFFHLSFNGRLGPRQPHLPLLLTYKIRIKNKDNVESDGVLRGFKTGPADKSRSPGPRVGT